MSHSKIFSPNQKITSGIKIYACALACLFLSSCASEVKLDDPYKTKPAMHHSSDKAHSTEEQERQTGSETSDMLDSDNSVLKKSIYFGFDQFSISDEFYPLIKIHAQYLSKNPSKSLVIQGNTDERGSPEYNLALGQKRAESVASVLKGFGVPSTQIETISFGEERPKKTGSDEETYSENRRVDFVYQTYKGSAE